MDRNTPSLADTLRSECLVNLVEARDDEGNGHELMFMSAGKIVIGRRTVDTSAVHGKDGYLSMLNIECPAACSADGCDAVASVPVTFEGRVPVLGQPVMVTEDPPEKPPLPSVEDLNSRRWFTSTALSGISAVVWLSDKLGHPLLKVEPDIKEKLSTDWDVDVGTHAHRYADIVLGGLVVASCCRNAEDSSLEDRSYPFVVTKREWLEGEGLLKKMFSWVMVSGGATIAVDRDNPELPANGRNLLKGAKKAMEENRQTVIYPEGQSHTADNQGEIGEISRGVFSLCRKIMRTKKQEVSGLGVFAVGMAESKHKIPQYQLSAAAMLLQKAGKDSDRAEELQGIMQELLDRSNGHDSDAQFVPFHEVFPVEPRRLLKGFGAGLKDAFKEVSNKVGSYRQGAVETRKLTFTEFI